MTPTDREAMTPNTPTRIGPRMAEALDYITRNPGCAILPVAEHVGPRGSRRYGYRTVHRRLEAGLVRNDAPYVIDVLEDEVFEAEEAEDALLDD